MTFIVKKPDENHLIPKPTNDEDGSDRKGLVDDALKDNSNVNIYQNDEEEKESNLGISNFD
jgi:hypothetical protein